MLYVYRTDDTGHWSTGPFRTVDEALMECVSILKVRRKLKERWADASPTVFELKAWTNNKDHRLAIKEN